MRLLYRVESNEPNVKLRLGPYAGSEIAEIAEIYDVSNNSDTHPTPRADVGLAGFWENTEFRKDYMFGFASISHYLNWFMFRTGREAIKDIAVIGVYEVPNEFFVEGQFQAIAHKDHMKHLHDLCPYTMKVISLT